MHQIPCRDLLQAHCLRSWLLSHEIQADVIHENGMLFYAPYLVPPQLLIDDADVPRILAAAQNPDPALDGNFIQSPEDESPSEDLGLGRRIPSMPEFLIFGLVFGFLAGLASMITIFVFGIVGGQFRLNDAASAAYQGSGIEWILFLFSLAGLGFGLVAWMIIEFSRTFRHKTGGLAQHTRCLAFIVFWAHDGFYWFCEVPRYLFALLLQAVRGSPF
jgi:hypothetical protein